MQLYDYQKKYFKHVKKNWIYNMDTGTGKTIMALTHYKVFFDHLPLVIFAPATKVKEGGWERTIEKFRIKQKYEVISYNKMSKRDLSNKNNFVIFDEAHRIKNSSGVWGSTAYSISKNYCEGFILLTATPLGNGWIDSINYLKMFGLTPHKTNFLNRFGIVDTSKGYPEVLGFKKIEKLTSLWHSISRRLNKKDALDLPELIDKKIYFAPSRKYLQIQHNRVYEKSIYDNSMSLRHGLRANVSTKDKIDYINELIDDVDGNIIIFYNYNSELEELRKILNNRQTFECNGHYKNYPTEEKWAETKNSITLANYKSGSEAVEFTYADKIIFFSPPESYTDYYQSIGRCHRLGQDNKVIIYKLVTKNTIEDDIYKSLDKKVDFCYEKWAHNVK